MKRYSRERLSHGEALVDLATGDVDELIVYLNFRAAVIEDTVRGNLMNLDEAAQLFRSITHNRKFRCSFPVNKAKGKKRHVNYFMGSINALTEITLDGADFDSNPGELCTLRDRDDKLSAVLSRRMDGAYPSASSPIAVWEVKEYYDNKSFGSRIADAIYETQLDGFEIREARTSTGVGVAHYLLVDGRSTWWEKGRSFLCRIIDLLHMGLVDEVLFGREIVTRWPEIVRSWRKVTK